MISHAYDECAFSVNDGSALAGDLREARTPVITRCSSVTEGDPYLFIIFDVLNENETQG